jgi:hypothetical protein
MRTLKQIEAARRNGAKSKGPATPEGKAIARQNSTKHGLAADPAILLTTENDDTYDTLLTAYLETYQPANGNEYDLVCQVVSASWKLRRISRIEAQLLEAQMQLQLDVIKDDHKREFEAATVEGKAFKTLATASRSIDLLLRYTNTARRSYDTALKALRELQRERRKAKTQNEPENAQVPAIPTTSKRTTTTASTSPTLAAVRPFLVTNDQQTTSSIEPIEDNIASALQQNGAVNKGEC